MEMEKYDFSGIVTAYNVLCGDNRVIKDGAFNHQAGQVIPLVWRHSHDDIRNFIGHGYLSVNGDPSGMRLKALFSDTPEGQKAKDMVQKRIINRLSIWANELEETARVQHGKGTVREVHKGRIREASLVKNGQNPGAYIDDVVIHSEENPLMVEEDGVIIHTDFEIEIVELELKHEAIEEEKEDEKEEEVLDHGKTNTLDEILDSLTPEQNHLFNIVLHSAAGGEKLAPTESGGDGKTVEEIFNSLNDEQKNVLYHMAGILAESEPAAAQGDNDIMAGKKSYNIFESAGTRTEEEFLAHEQVNSVLELAIQTRPSSLKALFKDARLDPHLQHSITNISNFLPNNRAVETGGPQWYAREMGWVTQVLAACSRRPFARIKSHYADLTADAARAKGYVTGAQKVEEVIVALQRETNPTTIYKLQKLDRDYIVDITEFDVVAWLKEEMRFMLQEEVARAILISDGRAAGADKIVETNVRPIYSDDATYTISKIYNDIGNEQDLSAFTAAETVALIDYIAASLQEYRGVGSPNFYCQPEVLTKLLLVRDANNLRIHRSVAELAEQLRVRNIVEIPPMSGMERTGEVDPPGLPTGTYDIATLGIIVNLADYVIGQDRGGKTSFFDDFDIDYNKYAYLYETRMSGALVNPKSAIAIELVTAKTA